MDRLYAEKWNISIRCSIASDFTDVHRVITDHLKCDDYSYYSNSDFKPTLSHLNLNLPPKSPVKISNFGL